MDIAAGVAATAMGMFRNCISGIPGEGEWKSLGSLGGYSAAESLYVHVKGTKLRVVTTAVHDSARQSERVTEASRNHTVSNMRAARSTSIMDTLLILLSLYPPLARARFTAYTRPGLHLTKLPRYEESILRWVSMNVRRRQLGLEQIYPGVEQQPVHRSLKTLVSGYGGPAKSNHRIVRLAYLSPNRSKSGTACSAVSDSRH
jgi:hypothetical protein